MKLQSKIKSAFYWGALVLLLGSFPSCKKFVDAGLPKNSILAKEVFNSDAGLTSAMAGLYREVYKATTFNGGTTLKAALMADELFHGSAERYQVFMDNKLDPSTIPGLMWSEPYKLIYYCNAIIEGIEASNGLSVKVAAQAKGEAFFMRAFCHFMLVNFFGDVPLITTTDYKTNNLLPRTAKEIVYTQIVDDLKASKELLTEAYYTTGKLRPNKYTAQALLARVYLYLEKWELAREEASRIIDSKKYQLEKLDNIFVATTKEAIWHMKPLNGFYYTSEGVELLNGGVLLVTPLNASYVRTESLNAFEAGDKRKEEWTIPYTGVFSDYYAPYKYKLTHSSNAVAPGEYYVMFRLAEQLLIRAEANAHLDPEAAVADLDSIRARASLPSLRVQHPVPTKENMLAAVAQERRVELMFEWGHRWFDLKRTGKSVEVLGPIKPGFSIIKNWLPIPQTERISNYNLTQNEF